jgi:hypothetical protein
MKMSEWGAPADIVGTNALIYAVVIILVPNIINNTAKIILGIHIYFNRFYIQVFNIKLKDFHQNILIFNLWNVKDTAIFRTILSL